MLHQVKSMFSSFVGLFVNSKAHHDGGGGGGGKEHGGGEIYGISISDKDNITFKQPKGNDFIPREQYFYSYLFVSLFLFALWWRDRYFVPIKHPVELLSPRVLSLCRG